MSFPIPSIADNDLELRWSCGTQFARIFRPIEMYANVKVENLIHGRKCCFKLSHYRAFWERPSEESDTEAVETLSRTKQYIQQARLATQNIPRRGASSYHWWEGSNYFTIKASFQVRFTFASHLIFPTRKSSSLMLLFSRMLCSRFLRAPAIAVRLHVAMEWAWLRLLGD